MGGGGGAPTTVNPEPMLLSETGLYMDTAAGVVAPDVLEFEPQFRLWSDGSLKKRWVKLPAGQQINTSNMNFWQYPTDTKLFKEFTRDGVRVETRLLWKRGAGDWYMMAYKWNAEQTEATAVPDGELDASGTAHDIPSQEDCGTCHGAMRDKALGFTAVSLAHGAEVPGLTLDDLVTMGVLSNPPAAPVATPTDSVARAAMGYLHANCGMCHNQRSTLYSTKIEMDLWLPAEFTTVEATQMYLHTFDVDTTNLDVLGATKRIDPGNLANSALYQAMNLRDAAAAGEAADGGITTLQMPPLGTEIVDPEGLAAVEAWITQLGQ
jgi:hypothetical protein